MRNGMYYLVALLLFLATIPMYRYILDHSVRDALAPAAVAQEPSVHQLGVESVDLPKLWYAEGEKLPPGYKCLSAGGEVYRTRIEGGATVIDPLYRSGQLVRCAGGNATGSSIR